MNKQKKHTSLLLRQHPLLRVLFCLLILLFSINYASAAQTLHDKKGEIDGIAPAGLENISAGDITLTDLYYGGQPLGSVLIKYTPTTILFLNPKGVLAKLTDVKNPDQILPILSQPMANNADKLCADNEAGDNCGQLNPPIVGVIFNPDTFRTDLFVNQGYVKPETLPTGLLPDSSAKLSYLNSLTAVQTGAQYPGVPTTSNYNFNSDNILSYENARLEASVNYGNSLSQNNNPQTYFNTIYGAYYAGDKLFEGGILNTTGNMFIPSETVLGAYAGTTTDTIQNNSLNDGTILQEFLPYSSTVNIYKDGRLMSTQHYNMGYQVLNTSSLPDGAYPIVIQIRSDQGQVTEKTRFFAKTNMIPPARYPQYYVNAGYLQKNQFVQQTNVNNLFPQFSKNFLYGTGFNIRALSMLGVSSDLTGVAGHNFLTAGTYFIGNGYQIGPEFLVGTRNDARGAGLQAQGNLGKWQSTLFIRQIWSNNPSTLLPTTFLLGAGNETQQFLQNLEETNTQESGTVSYVINNSSSIAFNGTYTKYLSTPATYSYGPQYQTFIYQKNELSVNLSLTANKTQDDEEILCSLTAYFNTKHWLNTASLAYRAVANGDANSPPAGPIGDVSSYWTNMNSAQQGVQAGVSAHADPQSQNVGASMQAANNVGSIQANVVHNIANSYTASNTIYSATALTHLVYADGKWAQGSGSNGDTGVIIYIASKHSGDKFDVYANDQYIDTVTTNTATPILLQPFQTYSIRVRDTSKQFYNYDQGGQFVTLYRGNMRTLTWQAQRKMIIYGLVTSPAGKPVRNQVVLGGVEPGITDNTGMLQAEILDGTKTLQSELPNHKLCTINLPNDLKFAEFVKLSDMVCRV